MSNVPKKGEDFTWPGVLGVGVGREITENIEEGPNFSKPLVHLPKVLRVYFLSPGIIFSILSPLMYPAWATLLEA